MELFTPREQIGAPSYVVDEVRVAPLFKILSRVFEWSISCVQCYLSVLECHFAFLRFIYRSKHFIEPTTLYRSTNLRKVTIRFFFTTDNIIRWTYCKLYIAK